MKLISKISIYLLLCSYTLCSIDFTPLLSGKDGTELCEKESKEKEEKEEEREKNYEIIQTLAHLLNDVKDYPANYSSKEKVTTAATMLSLCHVDIFSPPPNLV